MIKYLDKIDTIIFDLGGVIFDLDYDLTAKAFNNYGKIDFNTVYTKLDQNRLFDAFEKGEISSENFRTDLKKQLEINISDKEFDKAWNAMLLGWPKDRLDLIASIKDKYQLFLLSNTNDIHLNKVMAMLKEEHGLNNLNHLFSQCYFSNEVGMRKPDAEIFEFVINGNQLNPKKTLFIDDSPQHIEGARQVGLNVYHLDVSKESILAIL